MGWRKSKSTAVERASVDGEGGGVAESLCVEEVLGAGIRHSSSHCISTICISLASIVT